VLPVLRINEAIQAFISHAVTLWIIASVGWLVIRVIHMVLEAILERYDIKEKDNLMARQVYTQIRVIENIINVCIIVLTVACMLMTFPDVKQIGVSLLASAGAFGIILGFAAQKTLGNFIAGIQIAIAQPIRLDDVVIIENEWGWIEEITLTFVVVRIWDLRRLVVPISYFLEKPFQNWTRTSADILGSVFIYTDYTIPVKEVRDELTRLLTNSQYWDKKVNVLQVTDAKERVIELRALMSATDSPTAWNLRCEVREKLLEFLQKNFAQCLPRTRVEIDKA
jgi:small-conductance mechanosensitive channel